MVHTIISLIGVVQAYRPQGKNGTLVWYKYTNLWGKMGAIGVDKGWHALGPSLHLFDDQI